MESNKKLSYSMPTLLKRALAYLLVTAMVISGFNMVPAAKLTAEAAPSGNLDGATLVTTFETGKYTISNGSKTDSVTVTKDGDYYKVSINQVDYYLAKSSYCEGSQYHLINNDAGALYTDAFNKYTTKIVGSSYWYSDTYNGSYYKWNFTRKADFEAGNYKVTNKVYQAFTYNGTIYVDGTDNYLILKIDDYRTYIFKVKNTESGYLLVEDNEDRYACISEGENFRIVYSEDIEFYEDICQYWDIEPIPNTTVTFYKNAEDTTDPMEKTFENGEVVNAVNVFSRTGYSFDGYYTAATGGTKVFDSNGKACAVANYIEAEGEGDNQTFKWVYTGASLKLYAHWKRIYTDVTFSGNAKDNAGNESAFFAPEGGVAKPSVIRKLNVGDGFDNYALPIPERKGFKFDGYYTAATDGDMVFDAEGKPYIEVDQESEELQDSDYFAVSEDEKVTWKYLKEGDTDADKKLTLYAHWSRAYTNVTFDKNATKAKFDSEVEPIKFEAGKAVPKIPVATYEGFKLDGYYTKNNEGKKGEQVFDENAEPVVKENGGYFAVAEASDDEDAPEAGTILWTDIDTNKNEAESFYAYWTRTKSTITFEDVYDNVKGGNEEKTYKVGDKVEKVNVPSVVGFEFGGYYPTINGPNTGEDNTQVFDDAGLPVLNTDYIGNDGKWLDSTSARNNLDDNSTESLTLYAWWIPRKNYTISYYDREWLNSDISEGSYNITYVRTGDKQENVEQGNFTVKTASEAGIDVSKHAAYEFKGWSTKQNAAEPEYVAGKQYKGSLSTDGTEVKLYAVWTLKEGEGYRITFNSNVDNNVEANGIPSDDEITETTEVDGKEVYLYTLPSGVKPVRKGYRFKGWSVKATETAEDKIYKPGKEVEITSDTTFYAQWEINPTVSYNANGGTYAEGKEIQTASYEAGSTVLVVNPREIDEDNPAILTRTGYTFVGWVNSVDNKVYSESSDGEITNPSFTMTKDAVVLKAKWKKNKYSENVVADSDAYAISFTGTYSDEEDGTTKDIPETTVELTKGETVEGEETTDYVGEIKDVPHDADIILSVTVDSTYDADDIVVKVKDAEYKAASKKVAETTADVAEDLKGATTYTYKIAGVTSDDLAINITGAKKKTFNINYVCALGVLPATAIKTYEAGETKAEKMTLPTPAVTDQYTFAGWYPTAEDAEKQTAGKAVTAIAENERGNKTYYAAWTGKTYKVTFDKLEGTTKSGTALDANTQDLSFGKEEALKTFSVAFPGTIGPNGAAFLGWAKSVEDAIAHKVAYTDGQNVVDITDAVDDPATGDKNEADITLYAVWDIDKVTVSFNANGGSFTGGKTSCTETVDYMTGTYKKAADAVEESGIPYRTNFTFLGWALEPVDTVPLTDDEMDVNAVCDVTAYAVWSGAEFTLQYYKNNAGTEPGEQVKKNVGDEIKIGYYYEDDTEKAVLSEDDIPTDKKLIGWTENKNSSSIAYADGEKVIVDSPAKSLYPVFDDATTKVLTYNANGGSFKKSTPAAVTLNEGNEYTAKIVNEVYEPERTGYIFEGWALTSDATTAAYRGTVAEGEDIKNEFIANETDEETSYTLYAVWTPITYTVTYNANKAPEIAETENILNKEAADKTAPNMKTELADGLVVAKDESGADSTTAYVQTFTYDKADTFAAPQFDYDGYTFVGWAEKAADGADQAEAKVVYKDLQEVFNMTATDGANFDVYAIWKLDTPLTVTYRANGGELKEVPDTSEGAEAGATKKADAPMDQKYARIADTLDVVTAANTYYRDGYTFLGWSTSPKTYAAGEEVNYYTAKIDEEDADEGSGVENGDPEETGDGDADAATEFVIRAEDTWKVEDVLKTTTVTLYAAWQKLPSYSVVYDSNEGDGNVPFDSKTYHIDSDVETDHNVVTLDAKTVPSRKGYKFLGWAFDKDYKEETPDETTPDGETPDETTPDEAADPVFFKYVAATDEEDAKLEPASFNIKAADPEAAKNTVTLYAVWQANTYTVNFYQGIEDEIIKIGEKEFQYDDKEAKLPAVKDLSYTPEVEEGEEAVENKYTASTGMEFAGWAFRNGGTLSFADEAPVENLVTGENEATNTFDLYVVEKENIYTVTLKDDFDTIGKNFSANFVKDEWGIVDVNIKERAKDDKVVKPAAPSEEPEPDGDDPVVVETDPLETEGIDNVNHKFVVKYNKSLNDIDVPVAPGFVFKGYYATAADTSEGAEDGVMYYDASGNAVKTADFTENITLTAKWEATKFDVVFNEDGKQIDKMTQEYGQPFKMPESVKNLSYHADYEVVGWTPSVDKQHPATADIAGMTAPDKFDVRSEYDADIIAKLYNNYGAEVVLYPVYKTTVAYEIKFSAGDVKGATNLPGTQKVAEGDTFTLKFDDDDLRTPYCSGYTFIGWTETKGATTPEEYIYGPEKTYDIPEISKDMTLYAVWVKEITAADKSVTLKETQNSWDVSTLLFDIPEGYGEATYSFTGEVSEEDATLEDSTVTAKKVGVYEIQLVTAATEAVPSVTVKAKLTVQAEPVDATLDEAIEAAKLRLKDYADGRNPKNLEGDEITAFNEAITAGESYITGAADKEDVETQLTKAKAKVDEAVAKILKDRADAKAAEEADAAADKAVDDAVDAAEAALTAAEGAKKDASEADQKSIDDAVEAFNDNVDDILDELGEDASAEEKNEAAKAIMDEVAQLEELIETVNINTAAAKAETDALTAAKAAAELRLQDYADAKKPANLTPEEDQDVYQAAIDDGKEAIDGAETVDAVSNALISAKQAVDTAIAAIDTARAEAEAAKKAEEEAKKAEEEAKKAAEEAVDAAETAAATALAAADEALEDKDTPDDESSAVETAKAAVAAAQKAIDELPEDATTEEKAAAAAALQAAVDELETKVADANIAAAAVKAAREAEKQKKDAAEAALAAAKQTAKDRLTDYADAKKPDNITDTEAGAVNEVVNEKISAIDDIENIEEISSWLADAKNAVNSKVAEINEARAEAEAAKKAEEEAKKAAEEAVDAAETAAATALEDAEAALKDEDVADEDKSAIATAKEAVETAKSALDNLPDTATTEEKAAAAEKLQAAVKSLKDAIADAEETKEKEESDKAAEEKKLENAKTDAQNRLDDVFDAKNMSDYRDEQIKELEAAKAAGEKAIAEAKTPEEAKQALADAKKAMNAVKTDAALTKEEAAKKAAEEAAAKKAAEEAAAKKAAEAAAKKAAEEAAAKKAAEEAAAKKAAEEAAKLTSSKAKAANALTLNSKLKVSQTGNKLRVSWGTVKGAEEYGVFAQYCGKKFSKTATVTAKSGKTSVSIKKLNGKSLKLKSNYKVYVVAYRTINGKKTIVGKTLTAHVVGRKNAKYSNPKKLTIKSAKSVTLNVGKTSKIKAKVTLVNKNKKSLSKAHAKTFRYKSTNTSVAKVSTSGKITAVGKGTCTIYVYARNGYAKKVKVTVN